MPTHMVLGCCVLVNRVDAPKSLLERCLLGSHLRGRCTVVLHSAGK